jgi:small-conductance mechanosensitive channel
LVGCSSLDWPVRKSLARFNQARIDHASATLACLFGCLCSCSLGYTCDWLSSWTSCMHFVRVPANFCWPSCRSIHVLVRARLSRNARVSRFHSAWLWQHFCIRWAWLSWERREPNKWKSKDVAYAEPSLGWCTLLIMRYLSNFLLVVAALAAGTWSSEAMWWFCWFSEHNYSDNCLTASYIYLTPVYICLTIFLSLFY